MKKIMYLTNFIFAELFIFLLLHTKFYKMIGKKEFSQLYRFQFLEINSLMAKTIKNQFSKTKLL